MKPAKTAIDTLLMEQPRLGRLLTLLNPVGEETRVVGGAVRNALLGKPIHDFDLASTLLPEKTMLLARDAGLKTVPTGLKHGTLTVVVEGQAFEVTTLRKDIGTDGRHATVEFGRDFRVDALRRDFTINAFSLSLTGQIYDYADGLRDIEARKIRFIGDPIIRIREDFLRILRFFRFSAIYADGTLDEMGLAACTTEGEGLDGLSRERVGQEMHKLLLAPHALKILERMQVGQLLERVLPGPIYLRSFAALLAFEAISGLEPDFIRRLAALTDLANAANLRAGLRLANKEYDRLLDLRQNAISAPLPDDASHRDFKARFYRLGREGFIDQLCFHIAKSALTGTKTSTLSASFAKTLRETVAWNIPKNPFRAVDFMALGLNAGPDLGIALQGAEEAWIKAGFPEDQIEREAIMTKAAARFTPARS